MSIIETFYHDQAAVTATKNLNQTEKSNVERPVNTETRQARAVEDSVEISQEAARRIQAERETQTERDIFGQYDLDNDGTIKPDEVLELIKRSGGSRENLDRAHAFFRQIDTNANSEITFAEFQKFRERFSA